jgi:hypothetical protein
MAAKRYAISVTGSTYDRLRSVVGAASLQKFVDRIVAGTLDDPKILARVLDKCR